MGSKHITLATLSLLLVGTPSGKQIGAMEEFGLCNERIAKITSIATGIANTALVEVVEVITKWAIDLQHVTLDQLREILNCLDKSFLANLAQFPRRAPRNVGYQCIESRWNEVFGLNPPNICFKFWVWVTN